MSDSNNPFFSSPKKLEKLARKEFQDPPLKRTLDGPKEPSDAKKPNNAQWYIRVRKRVMVAGKGVVKKQCRLYLGRCSEVGMREAQRIRSEALQEINGQVYTCPTHIPFAEFVQLYNLKHLPTLGGGTQKKYRSHLVNHLVPEFGRLKLSAIGTEEIQDFLNRMEQAGLSWWTRNDLRNIMSGVFSKAEDWGYWTKQNPALKTELGRKRAKREKRTLTDEQMVMLLEELPADVALIVRLADSTGMRISEILGLRWRSVDLNRGTVRVTERSYRGEVDLPKSDNSVRTLPVGSLAAELRDRWRRQKGGEGELVFRHPGTGEAYDDRNLNQHFLRKVAVKHGFYFQGFGFHTFRRQTITGIQSDGGSSIEAARIAGHARTSMTNEYTVMEMDRKRDLIEKRQERLKAGRKTACAEAEVEQNANV